ncbi:hypothetical protein BDV59DRAFT_199724 [Aspergillus ambiguus]|uniref:uncharacterized protein n=1 Tax=Aspergillus ambiguus TaxID=176160 RepID=UPI003CCE1ABF
MCGPSRPSTGNRIAIMFPSTSMMGSYSLSFREMDSGITRAVFRLPDSSTYSHFQSGSGIDLRIEKHGDLTMEMPSIPLHRFRLGPSRSSDSSCMEFDLPERLDLGVSETGIVGRQVTVTVEGSPLGTTGRGIVGFD